MTMPTAGSPQTAIPVKITNESSRFMVTPASRIPTLTHSFPFANEWGSASSPPSSPSSFTKPPIGSQLSVYSVEPASSSRARATARNESASSEPGSTPGGSAGSGRGGRPLS